MSVDVNLVQGGNFRVFVQEDGSSPANPYLYEGCWEIGGIEDSLGEDTAIYCPSPDVANKWDIVGSQAAQPDIPTTDFTTKMDKYLNDFYWRARKGNCRYNAAITINTCGAPDDLNSWDAKIIVRAFKFTTVTLPVMNPQTGENNESSNLTGSLQLLGGFDRITRMQFEEVADSVVLAEALDGIFADNVQCGDCGVPSDGCSKQYVLTSANSGSPGLSSQIAYTLNKWGTPGSDDINTLGGLSANRLTQVGTKLVVVSEADRAHHYKSLTNIGTAGGWSRVTSGYVAGKGPRALWSKSAAETFVAGAGGYIYKMTNPASPVTVLTDGSLTLQNFNDIRGRGRTIVAVGNSNALVYSDNGGETLSLKTGPAVGVNLNTVEVISSRVWWVGANNGNLYYTINAGDTWSAAVSPAAGATTVNMIRFVDEIVGYVSLQAGGVGLVYRTTDNGYSWFNDAPSLDELPTAERYGFVAPCPDDYNQLLVGGRVSAGGDGVVAYAA